MKNLICSMLVLASISGAQAGCLSLYENKGVARDDRNEAILTYGGIPAGILLISTPAAAVGGALLATVIFGADDIREMENKFEKVHTILKQANDLDYNGRELKAFHRKVNKLAKNKYNFDVSLERTVDILIAANRSEELCPIVRYKKNSHKRAFFGPKALTQAVTANAFEIHQIEQQ